MKVCSTFHGFVLALREKVLENVLRECSQFCCGRTHLWLQQSSELSQNVYEPRQCHVYNVLLHEVGSVSSLRNTDFRRVL